MTPTAEDVQRVRWEDTFWAVQMAAVHPDTSVHRSRTFPGILDDYISHDEVIEAATADYAV